MKFDLRRRALIGAQKDVFPAWFQRCEYIKNPSAGRSWINTGVVPNDETGILYDFEITGNLANAVDIPFIGCRENSRSTRFFFGKYLSSSTSSMYMGFNDVLLMGIPQQTNVRLQGYLNYKNSRIAKYSNSNEIAISSSLYQPRTETIYINNMNNAGQVLGNDVMGGLRTFYAEITQGTQIIHKYFPGYNTESGVIGLYDTCQKEFLTNSGSSDFIKGADI